MSISLSVGAQTTSSERFLKWFIKEYSVKRVSARKLEYTDNQFTPLPLSTPIVLVENFHPNNICYYIGADSLECLILKENITPTVELWEEEHFEHCKVILLEDRRKAFWRLSEPVLFQEFVVIKVFTWDKVGYCWTTMLFKEIDEVWEEVQSINPTCT